MKTFIKAILSSIITLLLIGGLLTFGILQAAKQTLTVENLSKAINESVDAISQAIMNDDESAKEIKNAINNVMKEAGLNEEQSALLFENEDFKEMTSNYISSTIMHQIDEETEVEIPSEEELTDIVFRNIDTIAPMYGIENYENITKEDVQKVIHDNYDEVVLELNQFADSLGGLQ